MRMLLLALMLATAAPSSLRAQGATQAASVEAETRGALLDASRSSVQSQLGKSVRFVVGPLRVSGSWAFLHAKMQGELGQPLSYEGTPYANADRRGAKSTAYDALLQRTHGRWKVLVDTIGATDVPWTSWSGKYGAPASIFGATPDH